MLFFNNPEAAAAIMQGRRDDHGQHIADFQPDLPITPNTVRRSPRTFKQAVVVRPATAGR